MFGVPDSIGELSPFGTSVEAAFPIMPWVSDNEHLSIPVNAHQMDTAQLLRDHNASAFYGATLAHDPNILKWTIHPL